MSASPTQRLFVALDLPELTRAGVARWQGELLGVHPQLRPVPPAALHVTVAFIGATAGNLVEEVIDRVRAAVAGVPSIAFEFAAGPCLVPSGRPRLVALELACPDAGFLLRERLVAALAADGLLDPDPRPFWPHVTVARLRQGQELASIDAAAPVPGPFRARWLTLYASRREPEGASYDALYSAPLG